MSIQIKTAQSFASTLRVTALALTTGAALSMPAFAAEPPTVSLSGLESYDQYDQFIVKYRNGTPEFVDASKGKLFLESIPNPTLTVSYLRRTALDADVFKSSKKLDVAAAESLMRVVALNPNVEYVEVDRVHQAVEQELAPRYNVNAADQWPLLGGFGINATEAWQYADGRDVVVAVLDSGITQHPAIDASVLPGFDFVSDATNTKDGNGRDGDPSDPGDWVEANECGSYRMGMASNWHGTAVAGVIAGVNTATRGVTGVAPATRIVPVRVLGTCGAATSDIVDAIVWASGGTVPGVPINAHPAQVINISLSATGGSCNRTYQNAIDAAVRRGTTVVVSAGNQGVDVGSGLANPKGLEPASCTNVISVTGSNRYGQAVYSAAYGSAIDVAAPAERVWLLDNTGGSTPNPSGAFYGYRTGTSFAAPHVAGVAALIQSMSVVPKTPEQVELLIKNNVTAFPTPPLAPIGTGILNARAVVDAVNPYASLTQSHINYFYNIRNATIKLNLSVKDSVMGPDTAGWDDFMLSTPANINELYNALTSYYALYSHLNEEITRYSNSPEFLIMDSYSYQRTAIKTYLNRLHWLLVELEQLTEIMAYDFPGITPATPVDFSAVVYGQAYPRLFAITERANRNLLPLTKKVLDVKRIPN